MSGGVSELVQPKVEAEATATMDFEHYEEFYGTPGANNPAAAAHHHHHQVDHEGAHPQQLYSEHQQQYYDSAYYGYDQQQQTPQVSPLAEWESNTKNINAPV